MLIKQDKKNLNARIVICGVGGAGCNAINSMVESGEFEGVEFIALNTDAQVLDRSLANIKITMGKDLTKGLGAGGNPTIGRQAAEDSVDQLNDILSGADMVFITAGMGGGTGTGASPIIAGIAKNQGALTIGVVTKPFLFEGPKKMDIALKGIEELKSKLDALIVVPNQKILEITDRNITYKQAMIKSDEILKNAIKSISDIILQVGQINVDFADVRAIMQDAGTALMGIGISNDPELRAVEAAKLAINSPILDYSIEGAKGVIMIVESSSNISMHEISEAAEVIRSYVDPNALIKIGLVFNENLNDSFKVTVIATGFKSDPIHSAQDIKNHHSYGDNNNNKSTHNPSYQSPNQKQSFLDDDEGADLETPAFMRRRLV